MVFLFSIWPSKKQYIRFIRGKDVISIWSSKKQDIRFIRGKHGLYFPYGPLESNISEQGILVFSYGPLKRDVSDLSEECMVFYFPKSNTLCELFDVLSKELSKAPVFKLCFFDNLK